jgi:hypothetical protein
VDKLRAMNESCYEIDLGTLNGLPLNRKAREMLEKAGLEADLSCLHCVQLALWGIAQEGIEVEASFRETLDAMATWRPERIANFLLLNENDHECLPPGCEEAQTPEDMARVVIDDMERRMLVLFPWYGHLE